MNSLRKTLPHLGWPVAALLLGIMIGGGFQADSNKLGIVDLAKVVEASNFGKAGQAEFNTRKAAREGVLEFIDQYRVLTVEQATRFRDLSIKPTVTAEEKAELERIKADVMAAEKKSKELAVKTNPTAEDRTLMDEYSKRAQTMGDVAQRWLREFTNDLQTWADDHKMQSLTRARAAIQEVAKAQGFSVVFEASVAPYGANDLSDAALKAMNAKG